MSVLQNQSTALTVAAQQGHANVVDMLLQMNANVNHMNAVSYYWFISQCC